jgi:hypothetical protein
LKLDKRTKFNRLGETSYNNYNNKITIIKYYNALNLIVKFEDGCETRTCYSNFKKGLIKSPYDKSVYNVGFLGEGFTPKEKTLHYKRWLQMLNRCYNEEVRYKHMSYINCTVCNEWHNFQNFVEWCDNNYYKIKDERMELDKDILFKGNKIYSPETCVFAPQVINGLFERCYIPTRELPNGVSWASDREKYQATCSDSKQKTVHLGFYDDIDDCFLAYKTFKEQLIKEVANKYSDKIPSLLYEAMMNYQVDIDD